MEDEKLYPKFTGYVEDSQKDIARYEDVFAGGETKPVSRDWRSFMPKFKYQDWIPECVAFAHHSLVFGLNKAFDKPLDILSPTWLFFTSGGSQGGSSVTKTADTLRYRGSVYEIDKPFPDPTKYSYDTWDQLKAYSLDVTQKALEKSIDNKIQSYSAVNVSNKAMMIDALEYSPLIIVVEVIKEYWNGIYHPEYEGKGSRHAVVLTHIDSDGKYYVFDSLKPTKDFDGHHVLNSDWKIYYSYSYRDLPNNWKEKQQSTPIELSPNMNESIKHLIEINRILNSTDTNNMFYYFYARVATKNEIIYWTKETSQTLYKAMLPNTKQFTTSGYYKDVLSKQ